MALGLGSLRSISAIWHHHMNMPLKACLARAIRRDYNDIYVILITAFGTPIPKSRRCASARTITCEAI